MKNKGFRRELGHLENRFWRLQFSGMRCGVATYNTVGGSLHAGNNISAHGACNACIMCDIRFNINLVTALPDVVFSQCYRLGLRHMDTLANFAASQSVNDITSIGEPHQILRLPINTKLTTEVS